VLDEHTPPKRLTIGEAMWRGRHGTRILDTRDPQYFALGHLRGSVNVGLQGRYAEFAGAVVNPETGTASQGETQAEALANLAEATELFLEEFPLTSSQRAVVTTFRVADVA